MQVVAHQVEHGSEEVMAAVKLLILAIGRVDRSFGRRKLEDQPAVPDVDGRKLQHVPKKGAIGVRPFAL